ncbi:MAG: cellulase family glycosylhydrolase [Oscillospiraceae bacterium]|nr:cellulase family glycosylhydrolase [Oscillospiraceae bacterium]
MLLFSSCPYSVSAGGTMRDISTLELVKDMGIGINLGNTLEACSNWDQEDWVAAMCGGNPTPQNYETAWGSPVITKEIIEGIAKEGFGVLRIPVAWSNMMAHDGTYTINTDYDARVHEIVDWTLDSGMYAIINIHWDGGWVNKLPENKDETKKRFTHMWEQIADSFKDYGDYLMFEAQNEEFGWESIWNPWSGTQEQKERSYALCNEMNQAFVDTIRKSGGNNPKRHLLISGYNTGIDRTCDPLFKMPDDPANRMAISVHYYSPAGFAILEEDADWGKATPTWGSDQDYASLRNEMQMMKTNFMDKGIPVIIGEYGCPTKNKEPESVRRFLYSVCEEAYKCGHCPVMWSTPGGHYDREACKMADQELQKKLYEIGGKPFQPNTQPEQPQKIQGDLNADGKCDGDDLSLLSRFLLSVEEQISKEADLNGDQIINAADFSRLKQIQKS